MTRAKSVTRYRFLMIVAIGLMGGGASLSQETPLAPVPDTPAQSVEGAAPMPGDAAVPLDAASGITNDAPVPGAGPAVVDTVMQQTVEPLADQPSPEGERDVNLPHDLSPWGMFMAADMVVKGVMIGLALASLVTWTVWLAKTLEILGAKRRLRRVVRSLQAASTLSAAHAALTKRSGAGVTLVRAAQEEVERSEAIIDRAPSDGLKERVASRLARLEVGAGRRLTLGTGILATIGSVSPFVGLFGTVWGIMNAFIGISQAQSSSLAVVAPGIAEALLATAMGLVAAIPAVIFYNAFARSITGYRQMLADASAGIERLISRDLDHRFVNRREPAALAAE